MPLIPVIHVTQVTHRLLWRGGGGLSCLVEANIPRTCHQEIERINRPHACLYIAASNACHRCNKLHVLRMRGQKGHQFHLWDKAQKR